MWDVLLISVFWHWTGDLVHNSKMYAVKAVKAWHPCLTKFYQSVCRGKPYCRLICPTDSWKNSPIHYWTMVTNEKSENYNRSKWPEELTFCQNKIVHKGQKIKITFSTKQAEFNYSWDELVSSKTFVDIAMPFSRIRVNRHFYFRIHVPEYIIWRSWHEYQVLFSQYPTQVQIKFKAIF